VTDSKPLKALIENPEVRNRNGRREGRKEEVLNVLFSC
jgi:hypothetical protein